MNHINVIQSRIRKWILFFILALAASGLTAIPLQWELKILIPLFGQDAIVGAGFPMLASWLEQVNEGVQNGYGQYPFLAYGTDWLAFGHVAIAIAFIGPLRNPLRNIWVIEFGMIACVLVIPWAIIFSLIRDIPAFWTLIDMSFGIFGIIPLWLVRKEILKLQ